MKKLTCIKSFPALFQPRRAIYQQAQHQEADSSEPLTTEQQKVVVDIKSIADGFTEKFKKFDVNSATPVELSAAEIQALKAVDINALAAYNKNQVLAQIMNGDGSYKTTVLRKNAASFPNVRDPLHEPYKAGKPQIIDGQRFRGADGKYSEALTSRENGRVHPEINRAVDSGIADIESKRARVIYDINFAEFKLQVDALGVENDEYTKAFDTLTKNGKEYKPEYSKLLAANRKDMEGLSSRYGHLKSPMTLDPKDEETLGVDKKKTELDENVTKIETLATKYYFAAYDRETYAADGGEFPAMIDGAPVVMPVGKEPQHNFGEQFAYDDYDLPRAKDVELPKDFEKLEGVEKTRAATSYFAQLNETQRQISPAKARFGKLLAQVDADPLLEKTAQKRLHTDLTRILAGLDSELQQIYDKIAAIGKDGTVADDYVVRKCAIEDKILKDKKRATDQLQEQLAAAFDTIGKKIPQGTSKTDAARTLYGEVDQDLKRRAMEAKAAYDQQVKYCAVLHKMSGDKTFVPQKLDYDQAHDEANRALEEEFGKNDPNLLDPSNQVVKAPAGLTEGSAAYNAWFDEQKARALDRWYDAAAVIEVWPPKTADEQERERAQQQVASRTTPPGVAPKPAAEQKNKGT